MSKLELKTTPAVSIDSVGPVIAYPPATIGVFTTGVAPGLLIQIAGRNLGPSTKVNGQLDATGRLPFIVANTIVYFDNIPAPLISVQASSIVCVVPFEIASTTQVTVSSNGQRSNPVRTAVMASAPQILSIANQDGTANSADHPAKAGSVISLYVSGLGATSPPGADGLVNAAPLPVPLMQVSVYLPVGNSGAQITPTAVSAAPALIAGITQVNVRLPASIGATTNSVVLSLNSTQATVYLSQ